MITTSPTVPCMHVCALWQIKLILILCTPSECARTNGNCDVETGECICPANTEGRDCGRCQQGCWGHDPIQQGCWGHDPIHGCQVDSTQPQTRTDTTAVWHSWGVTVKYFVTGTKYIFWYLYFTQYLFY